MISKKYIPMLCALLAVPVYAQEVEDLSETAIVPEANMSEDESTQRVLVQTEFIELEQTTLSDLLYGPGLLKSGDELREDIQKLIQSGDAKVIENSVITSNAGEAAALESIKSMIYPTDFDPPYYPKNYDPKNDLTLPPIPTAFEERPLGTSIETSSKVEGGVEGDRKLMVFIRAVSKEQSE